MATTTFDTLTYAKKLQEAGFTAQQAEAQAEALRAVVDEDLATRRDLKEIETRLVHEIELGRREMEKKRKDFLIKLLWGTAAVQFAAVVMMLGVVIAMLAL